MTMIRKVAASLSLANRYIKAMQALGVKAIYVEAHGTWACGKNLHFAGTNGTAVCLPLGRTTIRATIDGYRVKMQPYEAASDDPAYLVIVGEMETEGK